MAGKTAIVCDLNNETQMCYNILMLNENKSQKDWRICGYEKIVEFLQTSVASQKISHAYIFHGPAHSGKSVLAEEFVKAIFCQSDRAGGYCQNCLSCTQIGRGVHPDVYRVVRQNDEKTGKLKKDIVIDQIRDLKSRLGQSTLLGGYKVAIIAEADHLNANAANALLKILEEPTPQTVIILLADNVENLPATIISRAQVFKFLSTAKNKISDYLMTLGADPERSEQLAVLAGGRPGLAVDFFHNSAAIDDYRTNIDGFLNLANAALKDRFKMADTLIGWQTDESQNAVRIKKVFSDWFLILRDLLLIKNDNEPLVVNVGLITQLKTAAAVFSWRKMEKINRLMFEAGTYLAGNVSSKLILENLIVNL